MELTLQDVFRPVDTCSKCGGEMLLEAESSENAAKNLVARCWRCGQTESCDLALLERFLQRLFPKLETWLVDGRAECPEGLLVTGSNLFTTTCEKRSLTEAVDEDGWQSEAASRQNEIFDREEAIAVYMRQADFEGAYHFASAPHDCPACRNNVNWIGASAEGLVGDCFMAYSVILQAWKKTIQDAEGEREEAGGNDDIDKLALTNEKEMRQKFIENFNELNVFGFTIRLELDRPVIIEIDGEPATRYPDAKIKALLAVEMKAFFKVEHYSAAQARNLIAVDFAKLESYGNEFDAGMMLAYSDFIPRELLIPGEIPAFSYPVRVEIVSSVASGNS